MTVVDHGLCGCRLSTAYVLAPRAMQIGAFVRRFLDGGFN